jgi:hypothetical protein
VVEEGLQDLDCSDGIQVSPAPACSQPHAGQFVRAEAKMSHVTLTGNVSPTGPFDWSEDIGFHVVALPKK